MNETKLRLEIDKAIDEGNMAEVERLLEMTSEVGDMPKDFVQSIKELDNNKEKTTMKKKTKIFRLIPMVAVVAVLGSITVFGAMAIKHYSIANGDKYMSISTNADVDDDELKALMDEHVKVSTGEGTIDDASTKQGVYVATESLDGTAEVESTNDMMQTFSSVAELEKAYGVKFVLPEELGGVPATGIEGIQYSEENKIAWVHFENPETEKIMNITLEKQGLEGNVTSIMTTDIDEGSYSEFKSKNGYTFDTFSESGAEENQIANIYVTNIGAYRYSIAFTNYTEAERANIIDNLDLEEYK